MKRFRSRRATGGLKVQEITGDHFSFMQVSQWEGERGKFRMNTCVLYVRAPSMDFLTSPQQLVMRKTIAYWPLVLRMVNSECILIAYVISYRNITVYNMVTTALSERL